MAYTTPLNVWERAEAVKSVDDEQPADTVSNGETLSLSNDKLIGQAFPGLGQDIVFEIDGTEVDTGDYTVDLRNGEVTYDGTDSGVPTVSYKYATVANSVVQDQIEAAEADIDDITRSTFDGFNTVVDEYYDGQGKTGVLYKLNKQPVERLLSVEYNDTNSNSVAPNYVEMSEGLGNDFILHNGLGVKFINTDKIPEEKPREVRVSYQYGYDTVPADIEEWCQLRVLVNLFKDRVHGAGIDGRDNFDPRTVNSYMSKLDDIRGRWRADRFDNFTYLAEQGQIS